MNSYILIGTILNPHGIKGAVRVNSFAESEQTFRSYKKFFNDEKSIEFEIKKIISCKENIFIVEFKEIDSRTRAESFKNLNLYIHSNQLQTLQEEEYYHYHLMGSKILDEEGFEIGLVKNIANYGSGDLLEVICYNTLVPFLIPFNNHFIKNIQLEQQKIIVNQTYIQSLMTLSK